MPDFDLYGLPDFPTEADRDLALWGHQPPGGNRGHESDFFDSLCVESAAEHARALVYALTETESTGTVSAPSAGHKHDTVTTAMRWRQVDSWRTYTLRDNSTDPFYGARVVSETSPTTIALIPFVVPTGIYRVAPRVQVQVPAGGHALKLDFGFFSPSRITSFALTLPDVDGGSISTSATGSTPVYITGSPVDLSSLSGSLTDDRLVLYLRVTASVSASTAQVLEVALTLPDDELSTVAPVDFSASLAPGGTLSASTLKIFYLDNVERLRQIIYGTTYPLPRHSRPHDHGEGRGEILGRHLMSGVYGPHLSEGGGATSGGTLGIPVLRPSGVSFSTDNAKLLAVHGILVPGGVQNLTVRLCALADGADLSFGISARPLSEYGQSFGQGQCVTTTIDLIDTGDVIEGSCSLDLSDLGDVERDRVLELDVWQTADGTSTCRLCSILVYPGAAPTTLAELSTHAPAESLPVAKILPGQVLSVLTAARKHRALNQTAWEALGGVPGLKSDLSSPDTTDAWRRLLSEPHQHRGSYTDDNGNRVNDGAVIRSVLWSQAYTANIAGGSPEAASTDANPVQGQLLTLSGGSDGGQFQGSCSIPRGLGAVDVYALIQPGTGASISRLVVNVNLWDLNTTSPQLATAISSGPFTATANSLDLYGFANPQDGVLWQPNAQRLSQGLGLWTLDALKQTADLPSTASVTHAARWTEKIRVEFTPDETKDLQLLFNFGIQTGAQTSIEVVGSYDEDARLLAILVVPAPGY